MPPRIPFSAALENRNPRRVPPPLFCFTYSKAIIFCCGVRCFSIHDKISACDHVALGKSVSCATRAPVDPRELLDDDMGRRIELRWVERFELVLRFELALLRFELAFSFPLRVDLRTNLRLLDGPATGETRRGETRGETTVVE